MHIYASWQHVLCLKYYNPEIICKILCYLLISKYILAACIIIYASSMYFASNIIIQKSYAKCYTRLHLQGKVARRAIVCVVQIFRTHIVQIFRTHIVQIYLEHSFAISRLVYASKIV